MGVTYHDGGFPNCHPVDSLVDKSLKMDLYKVFNLPAHLWWPDSPNLLCSRGRIFCHFDIPHICHYAYSLWNLHLSCITRSSQCSQYCPIPSGQDRMVCVCTFIRNQDLVRDHCLVDSGIWHANLPLNLQDTSGQLDLWFLTGYKSNV